MKMLSTSEAAAKLGVTVQRIHQLITEGRLPAQKVGRDYVITDDDLKLVENRPKVGRPPNPKVETTGAAKKSAKKGKK